MCFRLSPNKIIKQDPSSSIYAPYVSFETDHGHENLGFRDKARSRSGRFRGNHRPQVRKWMEEMEYHALQLHLRAGRIQRFGCLSSKNLHP